MKLYFTGSDVLLLHHYPGRKRVYVWLYRQFVKLSKFCTEEYWVVHEHLVPELNRFGITEKISVVQHPYNMTVYPKKKHDSFNILYYCPMSEKDKNLNEWIYGVDIWERVKHWYKGDRKVCFIEVDGAQDMSEIWPVTDFLLRCNRHDGGARMVDEAKINNVSYYWSYENPDFNEIIKIIELAR
jgi:hypothetical protein